MGWLESTLAILGIKVALAEDTLAGKKKEGEEEKEDKAGYLSGIPLFLSSVSLWMFNACSAEQKDRGVVGVKSKAEQKPLGAGAGE